MVIVALALGYDRNSWLFLFFILLVPVVIPLMAIWAVWVFRVYKTLARRRECYLAIALALMAPALGMVMERNRDQVRFFAWAPFHLDLINGNPDRDGVLAKWDVWGGMGLFNASYLARDGTDQIKSLDDANAWGQSLGLSCEIVNTERVWRKLYVLTTYEWEL